jgi:hypothetical protein
LLLDDLLFSWDNQFFSYPRRSNSNILEQRFRKFQIGHIRMPDHV